MITTSNESTTVAEPTTQETVDAVTQVKLDDVTGGWGGWGPYASPYGNPYAAARFAAAYDRRAAWYGAGPYGGAPFGPPPGRPNPWWGW